MHTLQIVFSDRTISFVQRRIAAGICLLSERTGKMRFEAGKTAVGSPRQNTHGGFFLYLVNRNHV